MRNAAILAALFLSSFTAVDSHADEGLRPVTHEDLWTMRRLAADLDTMPDKGQARCRSRPGITARWRTGCARR